MFSVSDVISKWRTIRDNYVRNLRKQTNSSRSGSASKKIKSYVYGEQLSFLRKNQELRNIDSNSEDQPISEPISLNINESEPNSSVNVDDGSYQEVSKNSFSTPHEKSSNMQKYHNVEQALIGFMESHKVTKKPMEEDEDVAFFTSLMPTVKSLTSNQKFGFRMHMMQYLHDIKNNTHINQSSNIPSYIQLFNTTPVTLFQPPSHTPHDFVRASSTSSTASYYSAFSRDEILNDNFNLQENYKYPNL